jgi:arabinogalactan oligomer/maltooligosaccharide transport system substrate-binding protein
MFQPRIIVFNVRNITNTLKVEDHMKRSYSILLLTCMVLALFVAACGSSSGGGSGNSNQPETVTIWDGWASNYVGPKQDIFNAYMKLHPNVTIKLVNNVQNLIQKSLTAVRANNGPDIIAWVDDSLGELVDSHTVIPLDQYISQSFVNSTYTPAAAQAVQFNGHVYGVPETVEAVTIMYNKKLVSASQLPTTTDQMLAFEQSYEKQHPGQYGIVWPTTDAYYNAAWFYGFGAFYVKPDGTVGLNTPQATAAGNFIASFRPYLPKQLDGTTASALFSEGKAAAIIDGPWAYSQYAKTVDIGFATLPTVPANGNTPGTPFVGVKSLWVTKNASDPALDADILKFYTNYQNQLSMIKQTGEIPANLQALNDPSVKSNPAISGFANQARYGTPLPNTPYMTALWTPVANALTAIWDGTETPAVALANAQTAAVKGVQGISS